MSSYILSKFAKSILYILGWSFLDISDEMKKNLKTHRYIGTISHTSIWDGVIFLLYKFGYPEIFSDTIIVIKPQIYDAVPQWIQNIFNNIGFMKATAYEEKNGGFVKSTTDSLRNKKNFIFLIYYSSTASNTNEIFSWN